MEEERYKTVSLPFYVILDPDEHVIATFPGSTRDVQQFASFLKSGTNTKLANKTP
jgi:thiol:disulfide interchange protein DsbD